MEMANEIDVTEEAQKRLCRFSYLSHCIGNMEERLAVLKKKVTTLSDASEEVEVSLTDDDIWIKVGQFCRVLLPGVCTTQMCTPPCRCRVAYTYMRVYIYGFNIFISNFLYTKSKYEYENYTE